MKSAARNKLLEGDGICQSVLERPSAERGGRWRSIGHCETESTDCYYTLLCGASFSPVDDNGDGCA